MHALSPRRAEGVSGSLKRRYHHHRHHHDNDFRYGLGFPLVFGLGYGLGSRYYNDDVDCIGRWHRHYSGRLHCHGQLVWD
jgi:hypothetical protein